MFPLSLSDALELCSEASQMIRKPISFGLVHDRATNKEKDKEFGGPLVMDYPKRNGSIFWEFLSNQCMHWLREIPKENAISLTQGWVYLRHIF